MGPHLKHVGDYIVKYLHSKNGHAQEVIAM